MFRSTPKALALGASVSIGLFGATPGALAAEFEFKVAHVGAVTQPIQKCVEVMKSYVDTYSNNRIDMQIFPAGQLGNFRQNVEQVQIGSIEMSITTGGGISNVHGPIQAFDIPYLFKNDRIIGKVREDAELNQMLGDDILKATKTVRLFGISGSGGWRSFVLDKGPINKLPDDWQGKKIRTVESPISMELARAVGLAPTPIPWQELYTSLATGIVYGSKNTLTHIMAMNFEEFLKLIYMDNHTPMLLFWWINDPWLQSLPDELKSVIVGGMERLKTVCNGYYEVSQLPLYKKFADAGGKIQVPTEEQMAFLKKGQVAVEKWFVEKYGTKYPDAIRAAVKRAEIAIAAEDKRLLGK